MSIFVREGRLQAEWKPVGRPESGLIQRSGARSDAKPLRTLARRAPSAAARDEVGAAQEACAAALLAARRGRKPIQPAPTASRHLTGILRSMPNKAEVGVKELKRRWAEIVGERLANGTEPEKIGTGGVLTVRVSGALAPFVQHQATLIVERCRLAGAKVKRIAIRQGTPPVKIVENVRPLVRPLTRDEEAELEASLAMIEAPRLKAALSRLGRAVRRS
jgi:hypothetical protein